MPFFLRLVAAEEESKLRFLSLEVIVQEKGNNNGQWWANQLLLALGGPRSWRQTGLRQLSGMLVVVFARTELEVGPYINQNCFGR